MSPISVAADRRFHRAHVKPGRRRQWRTVILPLLKYAALVTVGGFVLVRAVAIVAQMPGLQVARILVRGNQRLSNAEVLGVLNGLRGENIVLADLDAWRQRLLDSPWVQEASLRRSLPSTVEVMLAEREPVGIGRLKGELYLVDDRGAVIDQYGPQYADLDLPIIDGLTSARTGPGDPRGELAARLIVALRNKPQVARRLSQVDVSNPHNAAVILNGDSAVIYVGDDRFVARLESYLQLAEALRERVPDIDYVDLRFDDRIYVRPAGSRRR